MPNRIIKESICTSEKLNQLSDFDFRLWTTLVTYVDDFGRGDARPAIIKGRCFPLRDRVTVKDISNGLQILSETGWILLYTVEEKPYLCFPNWDDHQTVRNKKSKYPAPAEADQDTKAIENNCNQLQSNVPVIQSNPNPNLNPNRKVFTPPTQAEVDAYCRERGNRVDASRFVDFYESKGWKVGNQPMKDWRAAVRTWEREDNRGTDNRIGKPVAAQDYQQRDYSNAQQDAVRRFVALAGGKTG